MVHKRIIMRVLVIVSVPGSRRYKLPYANIFEVHENLAIVDNNFGAISGRRLENEHVKHGICCLMTT